MELSNKKDYSRLIIPYEEDALTSARLKLRKELAKKNREKKAEKQAKMEAELAEKQAKIQELEEQLQKYKCQEVEGEGSQMETEGGARKIQKMI